MGVLKKLLGKHFPNKTREECEKNYFSRRNRGDCFGCSLANLIYELSGDKPFAEKVFENYGRHRLVSSEGRMNLLTATRLLTDLTEGTYEGILFTTSNITTPDKKLPKRHFYYKFRAGANEFLKVVREEKEKGRIKPLNRRYITDIYRPPALLSVAYYDDSHTVVHLGNDKFIDVDGKLVKYPFSELEIVGILHVWTADADPCIMAGYK